MSTKTLVTVDDVESMLAQRRREVSLAWALDGDAPAPSAVEALGRPELAARLRRARHNCDEARAGYAAGVSGIPRENLHMWEGLWRAAAREARAFLAEVSRQ